MYLEQVHGRHAQTLRACAHTLRAAITEIMEDNGRVAAEGYFSLAKLDVCVLKGLDTAHAPAIAAIRDARRKHASFLDAIVLCEEGGLIAVIESGMDCDCVTYDGRVHIIDATVAAYDKLEEGIAEWADGPFQLRIERPAVAARVRHVSRDNVMEAYENGHPHHVIAAMPSDPASYTYGYEEREFHTRAAGL